MGTLPSRIGQFEVLRQIGSGGMGAVYLGRDPELDRQVAIKVIREEVHDQEVLDRFFREARAAAALRHPNIITIYASGQHEHQPYMVMEFIDGDSLADIIRKRRSVKLVEKLSFLEQICAGLHFAHRAGIVHRDIKPANVMVDRDGVVRILDFGIARIEGSAMTQDGALMGSLNYMSPEQMLGRPVDHRSDIFSVGAVAYELVCNQQAFKGGLNDGLLQRLPHEDPPLLCDLYPGLPRELEQVIMRALQKAPENRYQDLAEMRSALLNVHHELEASTSDDQRTVMIPRGGFPLPESSVAPMTAPPGVSILGLATPASAEPAGPAPTSYDFLKRPDDFDDWLASAEPAPASAPAPDAVPIPFAVPTPDAPPPPAEPAPQPPATQIPATQTWQVKKKPAQAPAKTPTTVINPRARADVVKPPTSHTHTAIPRPQPQQRGSSWKWIAMGSALAALVVGAVAAIPWLTAPPPSTLERERPGIEAAMERFRMGYRNRSLGAVAAAFPTLPRQTRQAMERTFTNCVVYEVTFDAVQVQIPPTDEATAQVDVSSTHTCTPQSGGGQTTTQERETYTLRKDGDAWVISGVSPNRPQ